MARPAAQLGPAITMQLPASRFPRRAVPDTSCREFVPESREPPSGLRAFERRYGLGRQRWHNHLDREIEPSQA
jgi:hypothetical protein